ncbi:MAG TPA: hypothetical protein VFC31_15210 [Candidatus Limnocylindria bacterium]|nr:hypothetical protein [Candidatus Limnocylindria bacterium]
MTLGARRAWVTLAVVALAIALVAIGRWLWALGAGVPILYGEGAVAHAAILARDRAEYAALADPRGLIFVAANYPPLYFRIAGIADPFVAGRAASIVAALFVAAAIARTAFTRSGVLAAVALAATWLACMPVATWGPAVKPDLVALAFTVAAVLAADGRRRPALAGVLVALAIWSKPTAALPAIALAVSLGGRATGIRRYAAGIVAGSAAVLALAGGDPGAMFEHVVAWNALPWHADQALLLVLVLAVVFGVPLLSYAFARPSGAIGAYAVAAAAIVVLGGREGATINYLLDLVTAATLGLAASGDRVTSGWARPALIAVQLVVALALFDPLGLLGGRSIGTGAWASPARLAAVHVLPGDLLVEDAGLLVADGRVPKVDDLFLWSRLLDRGALPERDRLLDAVSAGEFDAVVSEVDLSRIAAAPAYERQRWHPRLVDAVLARYRLTREADGLFVYQRAISLTDRVAFP